MHPVLGNSGVSMVTILARNSGRAGSNTGNPQEHIPHNPPRDYVNTPQDYVDSPQDYVNPPHVNPPQDYVNPPQDYVNLINSKHPVLGPRTSCWRRFVHARYHATIRNSAILLVLISVSAFVCTHVYIYI